MRDGYAAGADGTIFVERFKYLHNLLQMPAVLVMLLAGVVLVLAGIWLGGFGKSRKGIWFAAPGAVLVVMSVFFLAGFNGTAYYKCLRCFPRRHFAYYTNYQVVGSAAER